MRQILRVSALIASLITLHSLAAHASETLDSGGPTLSEPGSSGLNEEERRACSLAGAGRLAIASIYGSCDAAQTINPKDGSGKAPADPLCNASTKTVSGGLERIWQQGGFGGGQPKGAKCTREANTKPTYSQSEPRVEYKDGEINPAPKNATDCSGLVSSVYLRAGLNLTPNQQPGKISTTAEMVNFGAKNSCFDAPKLDLKRPMLPGDLVVVNDGKSGHVWTIDRVGEKPFGDGGCDKYDPRSWDFTILESSGSKDGNAGGGKKGSGDGVSISEAKVHANVSGNSKRFDAYKMIWDSICHGPKKPVKKNQPRAQLLRHVGDAIKGCTHTLPNLHFRNEDCVSSCENLQNRYVGKAK